MPEISQLADRIMIFIDGSNLFWTTKGFRQDFRLDIPELIKRLGEGRSLVRPYYYCAIGVPPNPAQLSFHNKLKYSGIQVVSKPLRRRGDKWVEKGVDIALVTDLLAFAFRNVYDTAIIVSGDKDFEGAIEEVKRLGKRVEIASFEFSISEDLKMLADRFVSLDALADQIERPQES